MKRNKDKLWRTVKYKGDLAIYAKCGCGFEYCCSSNRRNKNGTWSVINYINPNKLYHYCPNCGAKKKRYESIYTNSDDLPPWRR